MTAPDVDRIDPPRVADERASLDAWLEYYRASILHKCAGLDGAQLAEKSCPPSPMSMIGLVRHLVEMERMYVHKLAEPDIGLLYCTDDSPDGDFDDVSAGAAFDDLDTFAVHCGWSREVLGKLGLDDGFGTERPFTVRWSYHYLIKEYARHLGHADLLRERIDGVIGE
ncbi:DinB family protein [Virgisporangium ochraceum]|uniref:Mini-circle protein n=1 Tax=Virgisporangium ochraceum TaxID=65505 RepID=A0A8J4EBV3_9ACTN|nr:DUF664 domain-containing protein [Virgisporangium ochraceum]GIJ68863.1 hypothetical protein Voc01_037800 [Virgisporangium ochraceum]